MCVCVCVCVYVHNACVYIRGQLVGVSSLYRMGSWD